MTPPGGGVWVGGFSTPPGGVLVEVAIWKPSVEAGVVEWLTLLQSATLDAGSVEAGLAGVTAVRATALWAEPSVPVTVMATVLSVTSPLLSTTARCTL